MDYSHLKFIGQGETEKILYFSRRHGVHLTYLMLRNNILGLIIGLLMGGGLYLLAKNSADFDESIVMDLCILLVLLMVMCASLLTWTIWYLTITVVTNRRLVKIVQKGLFYHYARDLKLLGLQDTTYSYGHPIQYLFNYGSIKSHTSSGEEGKFEIRYLPNPRGLHHYINEIINILEISPDPNNIDLPVYNKRDKKVVMQ